MSAAQIIAQLTAASRKLDETHAKLAAAAQDADEARELVSGALAGGSGQLTGALDRLHEAVTRTAGLPPAAKQQVQDTIAKVRALGN